MLNRLDRAGGQFLLLYGGRIASGAAAFLAIAIAAQVLGPAKFGRFAILLAVLNVTAGLVGPALDTAMVRFAARELPASRDGMRAVFRAGLRAKAVLAAIIVAVGALIAAPFQARFMPAGIEEPLPVYAVFIAFVCAAAFAVWTTFTAQLQAQQRFALQAGAEGLHAALRLLFIAGLGVAGLGSEAAFIAVHGVVSLVMIGCAGVWWIRQRERRYATVTAPAPHVSASNIDPAHSPYARSRDMLRFARWLIVACVATSLAQGLDVLILGWFDLRADRIGYYRAALTLAVAGELAMMSLFQVLLPKASQLNGSAELNAFLRHHQLRSVPIALAALPLIAVAGPVVRLAFGPEYVDTPVLFAILILGTACAMTSAPAGAVIYAANRPQLIAALELTKLILLMAAGVWAAPRYGVFGMACAVAGVRVFIAAVTFVAARYVLARMDRA